MLKKIISNEDTKEPLSDLQIANNLSNNGIKVARRTVAKYREALSIPSSKDRRKK